MKNLFQLSIFALSLLLLSSCSKQPPLLEIYVSAKESDRFTSVSLNHETIHFATAKNGVVTGGSQIQQFSGADVLLDLTTDENVVLVGNETHWADDFGAMRASLFSVVVTDLNGNTINAIGPATNSLIYAYGDYELMDEEVYRVEFIYDIDASITLNEVGNATFVPVFEVILENQ